MAAAEKHYDFAMSTPPGPPYPGSSPEYPPPPYQQNPYQPQQSYQPQPYYQQPSYPPQPSYQQPRKTSGMAIAAMVLGILGFLAGLPALLGVIFGIVALNQPAVKGRQQGGRGMAITGIVVGGVWLLIWILYFIGKAAT
ncbi:MAG: DUF4190 domain-containing protein [Mycobacterium sp.]